MDMSNVCVFQVLLKGSSHQEGGVNVVVNGGKAVRDGGPVGTAVVRKVVDDMFKIEERPWQQVEVGTQKQASCTTWFSLFY